MHSTLEANLLLSLSVIISLLVSTAVLLRGSVLGERGFVVLGSAMPTLVNYSGDDEFGSFCASNPMDISRLCTVYCPPRKRARVCASYPIIGLFEPDRSSIESLPDECLFEIFRHVEDGKDRNALGAVSKHWLFLLGTIRRSDLSKPHQIGDDEDGYLTRCLEGKKSTDIRLAAIAVGTGFRLEKLSVRGNNLVRGVTNRGLSSVARSCPSLRSLSLWDIDSIGDESVSEIGRSLEKLDLNRCSRVSSKGIIAIAKNCPNLTSLSLESCPRIGNDALEEIGKLCPNLESVSVKDCPLIRDRGIASLVSSSSPVLTKVKLHGLGITDFTLAAIGHYGKSITNLVLSSLKNVTEKGFWVMGNARGLGKLEKLSIASCGALTNLSLEAVGKGCHNLKHLSLRKCPLVSDFGLLSFVKTAAGSIESIHLEELHRVSKILGVLENCRTLKSLSVVKCMGIQDTESPLLPKIPSLRSLTIQNCPGFGTASLRTLFENSSSSDGDGLVKVNLRNCLNVTDITVSALARAHGGTLEVLNLDGCRRVTDAGMVSIGDNCLVLNDLDVSKCSVSDSGVSVLERLNLQVLSLSGCSLISNKSLSVLKRMGSSLVGLNLQNCRNIGAAAAEKLSENLWRCDILY